MSLPASRSAPGREGHGPDCRVLPGSPRLNAALSAIESDRANLDNRPALSGKFVMNAPIPNSFRTQPDAQGHFGQFGGRYVAETLMPLILDLERNTVRPRWTPPSAQFDDLLEHYVGRPSPLYLRAAPRPRNSAARKSWFKRDELNHTGAHKINNCIGQILLAIGAWARSASSPRPAPASTASPPPPSARASACPASIYMGATDVARQAPNVFRMKLLGAEVVPVTVRSPHAEGRDERGAARLGRPMSHDTFYIIGTAAGPHPYPSMVRDFQSVIGKRSARADAGAPKAACPICSSPASAAAATPSACSTPSSTIASVEMIGVEAAGHGLDTVARTPASITAAARACCTATSTYLLQDDDGQILEGHSISAGLDYPGIGPEHAWLQGNRPRRVHLGDRHRSARRLPAALPYSKASSPRWNPPTPSPR